MTDQVTSLDGFSSSDVTVHVPAVGVWILTCTVADDSFELSERQVTATVGSQSFVGTIDMDASGEFIESKKVRIIGGKAGWRKTIKGAGFHNDIGVKRATIAANLIAQTGEVLGDAASGTVGIDYAWGDGTAATRLEGVFPDWRVGYDGKTYLNAPAVAPQGEDIEALDYDKHAQTVVLGMFETMPCPGMQITDERFGTVTIRALTITASGAAMQAVAWFGAVGRTRLGNALDGLMRGSQRKLLGRYRYEVTSMAADGRVNLKAIKTDLGLPDLLPITQTPGVPGWQNQLVAGSVVHVEFLDGGDPSMPRIVGYEDTTPTSITYDGGDQPVARVGDMVQVVISPGDILQFDGTIDGAPVIGVITPIIPVTLIGIISTGKSGLFS
jgi:hypothetical protein